MAVVLENAAVPSLNVVEVAEIFQPAFSPVWSQTSRAVSAVTLTGFPVRVTDGKSTVADTEQNASVPPVTLTVAVVVAA
jgi:hypothetical protein